MAFHVCGACRLNTSPIDSGVGQFSTDEIALHGKASRSQVGSFVVWLSKIFLSCRVAAVAILPSAFSMSVFARCKLGALVSSVLLPNGRPALPLLPTVAGPGD